MPELSSYDYAVVRVVPSLDRGEFLNVGVILHARTADFNFSAIYVFFAFFNQ